VRFAVEQHRASAPLSVDGFRCSPRGTRGRIAKENRENGVGAAIPSALRAANFAMGLRWVHQKFMSRRLPSSPSTNSSTGTAGSPQRPEGAGGWSALLRRQHDVLDGLGQGAEARLDDVLADADGAEGALSEAMLDEHEDLGGRAVGGVDDAHAV